MTHKKRQGKKKVSLELFRCREPGIALEMVEIEPAPVRVGLVEFLSCFICIYGLRVFTHVYVPEMLALLPFRSPPPRTIH